MKVCENCFDKDEELFGRKWHGNVKWLCGSCDRAYGAGANEEAFARKEEIEKLQAIIDALSDEINHMTEFGA